MLRVRRLAYESFSGSAATVGVVRSRAFQEMARHRDSHFGADPESDCANNKGPVRADPQHQACRIPCAGSSSRLVRSFPPATLFPCSSCPAVTQETIRVSFGVSWTFGRAPAGRVPGANASRYPMRTLPIEPGLSMPDFTQTVHQESGSTSRETMP